MMFIYKIFVSTLIIANFFVWGLEFEERWKYITGLSLVSLGGILLGLVWLSI